MMESTQAWERATLQQKYEFQLLVNVIMKDLAMGGVEDRAMLCRWFERWHVARFNEAIAEWRATGSDLDAKTADYAELARAIRFPHL